VIDPSGKAVTSGPEGGRSGWSGLIGIRFVVDRRSRLGRFQAGVGSRTGRTVVFLISSIDSEEVTLKMLTSWMSAR